MSRFTDAEIIWTNPQLARRAVRHFRAIYVNRGPEWRKRMRRLHEEVMNRRKEKP